MSAAVQRLPTGMRAFTLIWLGQLISLLGTGMTRFAITVWAYQMTGSATALALVGFFSFTPVVILSPLAGALVDRWNRKLVMALSDLAAGLATVALLILHLTSGLHIWHLYAAGAFAGAFEAFQFPAFSASISTMLKKEQYGRANGMMALADSASGIVAPFLAGVLLPLIGLGGVMTIDVITFVLAVAVVLLVFIPQPRRTAEGAAAEGSLLSESLYGFRYIWSRASLLGLQLAFFFSNLTGGVAMILTAPMILARTNANEFALGAVQSALGVGGVVGSLLLSLWGGPKRRVHGVLLGFIGAGLLGEALMGAGQTLPVWLVAGFFTAFFIPMLNGANQAIWQAKVVPDLQGRVFAARRLIAQITGPFAMLIAGPLADRVFEPALRVDGAWAAAIGWLVGVGPGAGMGLLILITGLAGALIGLLGYLVPAIREAEDRLPDHDALTIVPAAPAE